MVNNNISQFVLISKRVGKSENIGLEKGESFETLVACPHKDFKIPRKLVHFQANLDENNEPQGLTCTVMLVNDLIDNDQLRAKNVGHRLST